MPVYRVELAKSGRAICQNTTCKKNQVKIEKGSLRHGTYVEINEQSSWRWKHWGCVTPVNCESWRDITEGGDPDLIDGYDELDDESKKKVVRAIKQGHVDDEDWIGDVEKNRPGQKGYFNATPKKAKKEDDDDDVAEKEEEASPVKPKGKKGKQATKSDDPESPAKKSRGSNKTSKTKADEEPAVAPKKRGRPKKAADEEPPEAPAAKKPRGRPAKTSAAKETSKAAPAPKSRGRPKKA